MKPTNDNEPPALMLDIPDMRVFGLLVLRGILQGAYDVLLHMRNRQLAPPKPTLDEVMTADEVASFLGVDRTTVYEAATRNEIPHKRLGRRVLFRRDTITEWFKSR